MPSSRNRRKCFYVALERKPALQADWNLLGGAAPQAGAAPTGAPCADPPPPDAAASTGGAAAPNPAAAPARDQDPSLETCGSSGSANQSSQARSLRVVQRADAGECTCATHAVGSVPCAAC